MVSPSSRWVDRLTLAILLAWVFCALAGPWFAGQPNEINLSRVLMPPHGGNSLGYDDLGRSLGDRLLVGARVSFWIATGVVTLSATLGTLVGTFAAWRGGWWDHLLVRLMDLFLAFPGILLAIALAGLLGPGIGNGVVALAAVGWVGYARLARAQVLSLKYRDHVQAAKVLGVGEGRIVIRHLLPLIMAPLIVEATFGIAAVVTAEAGLSFLGLGAQPPTASWGTLIRDGTRYLLVAPHLVLVPGLALAAVVLAINLLGDRLRDWLDVRGLTIDG